MLTINNTLDGYLKDVEILGNTIQNEEDLADIRSVGEKVEGQELYEIPVLSVGKNLFDASKLINGKKIDDIGNVVNGLSNESYIFIKVPSVKLKYSISTVGNVLNPLNGTRLFAYDKNLKLTRVIGWMAANGGNINLNSNETYIGLSFMYSDNTGTSLDCIKTIQLEEGTVATPYEPYQEDKLTILSPVQLEKVGNVRDRIIEKDGVLGVEKNVNTVVLNGSESWRTDPATDNMINMWFSCENIKANTIMLCDKFNYESLFNYSKDKECIGNNNNNVINLALAKSRLVTPDAQGFKQWLQNNNVLVKYPTTQPQFIPLPHDQQVKLRTFTNKTNILFGCEIEGTIKAQVPKSLGATVNTHTEQINNLNKELDRVKKLEESTVSTVTTESDFTTVEATSNGYFEDVKLEGKTLVNLLPSETIKNVQKDNENFIITDTWLQLGIWDKTPIKPNTTYTIIVNVIEKPNNVSVRLQNNSNYIGVGNTPQGDMSVGINVFTSTTTSVDIVDNTSHNYLGFMCSGFTEGQRVVISKNMVLLEGDHTKNPPSYFEGLKSVGDGVDEIVVSSCNNIKEFKHNKVTSSLVYDFDITDIVDNNFDLFNPFSYKLKVIINDAVTNKWKRDVINLGHGVHNIKLNDDEKVIKVRGVLADGWHSVNSEDFFNKICFSYNFNQDKKRLLYYNEETQTWEKPILRQWDSIEKHSDGKYYYHQRSGEIVLNGSENWGLGTNLTNTLGFNVSCVGVKQDGKLISTTLKRGSYYQDNENIHFATNNGIFIRILKSKLSTQDVEGFKQWLQTNNVTVVYQLAQEKVYECTNIDLITYANKTNYIVECGAIVPRTTLKVHNNISNVVSLLQKKVSLLESNITKYMITQNRMQLASTYSADSVTFKVDYFSLCGDEENYNEDLYNLILNNILVGKDNYDYDKMFTMILDYASWNQISWEQFDILVGLMDIQHNPPVEELPTEDEIEEDIIESEETPVE